MESHTCCVCRDGRASTILDHEQQSSAGFFPWLPVLTISMVGQDNDARWKGASWITRFLRELDEYCSWGLGDGAWLKEYSLRILILQTVVSQGKQNICARIRPHAYAPQRFAMTYSFFRFFWDGFCLGIRVDAPPSFPANLPLWRQEIDCSLQSNSSWV
jgi:hypothetical protein